MLEKQRQIGKIRHLGVSIAGKGGAIQAQEARAYGAEVLQVVYNRLERKAEEVYFPYAKKCELGILARVPLASGFLTGKFKNSGPFPANDVRSTFDAEKFSQWLIELDEIRKYELPADVPMAQWALAWCLKNPLVSGVIPGCKDAGQMEMNALAASLL
jgi:aryl-alcohol dehydrogenase-like predicted oxidoreductase